MGYDQFWIEKAKLLLLPAREYIAVEPYTRPCKEQSNEGLCRLEKLQGSECTNRRGWSSCTSPGFEAPEIDGLKNNLVKNMKLNLWFYLLIET